MALRSCTTARAELPAVGLANCKAEHRPAIGNSGMALELGPRRQLQGACLFIRKHGPANKGRDKSRPSLIEYLLSGGCGYVVCI